MIAEEPRLNYKRLFLLIGVGIVGAFSLYKLSCSRQEEPKETPYSTLVDKVTQELPNNPEFIDILIQRSISIADKQKIILQKETNLELLRYIRNLMVQRPELSDYFPKKAIDYQLEKNNPTIGDYIFGRKE